MAELSHREMSITHVEAKKYEFFIRQDSLCMYTSVAYSAVCLESSFKVMGNSKWKTVHWK